MAGCRPEYFPVVLAALNATSARSAQGAAAGRVPAMAEIRLRGTLGG